MVYSLRGGARDLSKTRGTTKRVDNLTLVIRPLITIVCVHMTSRRPCWMSKQRNGGHVGGVKFSFGDWVLFLCKFLPLFHYANMASGHMSEHTPPSLPSLRVSLHHQRGTSFFRNEPPPPPPSRDKSRRWRFSHRLHWIQNSRLHWIAFNQAWHFKAKAWENYCIPVMWCCVQDPGRICSWFFFLSFFFFAFLILVYKKAEAISREYSSTKGPGTTARPWEHPFFLKLGPIIRKKLEKANHENGFM